MLVKPTQESTDDRSYSITSEAIVARDFSLYIDGLRSLAAIGVVLYHIKYRDIGPSAILQWFPGYGHEFVILFFVLSGYVIAASADRKKNCSLSEYAFDRVTRLYSVALPALVISGLISTVLGRLAGSEHDGAGTFFQIAGGILWNLFFFGQSWSLDISPPSNPPFWSLCYEVAYYALFGCIFYMRGFLRIISLVAIALLAGPKILLLMPCWLVGVAVYHFRHHRPAGLLYTILGGIVVPVLVFGLMSAFKIGQSFVGAVFEVTNLIDHDLGRSNVFPKDWITSVLVGLHLHAIYGLKVVVPVSLAWIVKTGAAMTFTLYLLHYPILLSVKTFFDEQPSSGMAMLMAFVAVFLSTVVVSSLTERRLISIRRRCRPVWNTIFNRAR